MKTFYLPDLGEGLAEGEINQWHVKEGDEIKLDEPLVAIETAKAIVEVPSPFSGKVIKLYGSIGDVIPTGGALADFEVAEKTGSQTVAGEIKEGNEVLLEKASSISKSGQGIKVLPAVRALAKKLNVDLLTIVPSGESGTITADDVKHAALTIGSAAPLEKLHGVRRTMAMIMAQSHAEVVPVTVMDDADITSWYETKEFTTRVILAMVKACQQEPALNAWYDSSVIGRRIFPEINIGLAIDTPDGLFVPVIKNAQTKSADELREEINRLKQEVAERTVKPGSLQGATIVLSNFGKFAGRYANPIIVPPTVAILGVGVWRQEMLPIDGVAEIRATLPLSLSFDHRAVTGGEATRFLGALISELK